MIIVLIDLSIHYFSINLLIQKSQVPRAKGDVSELLALSV